MNLFWAVIAGMASWAAFTWAMQLWHGKPVDSPRIFAVFMFITTWNFGLDCVNRLILAFS